MTFLLIACRCCWFNAISKAFVRNLDSQSSVRYIEIDPYDSEGTTQIHEFRQKSINI
mgnify:CR=1 FL=1